MGNKLYKEIEKDTIAGIVKEQFDNETEVEIKLKNKNINLVEISDFFKKLEEKIKNYYTKGYKKVDEKNESN